MTNEELFAQAVARVESESIRQWATDEHNKIVLLRIAKNWLDTRERGATFGESEEETVLRFSTWLVCQSMGM